MTNLKFEEISYSNSKGQVNWSGSILKDGPDFKDFMGSSVSSRLYDTEAKELFKSDLQSLTSTGFETSALEAILAEDVEEERDWAVGEAFAEALLTHKYDVIWPWNTERDKKTPLASLPGADLVGFRVEKDEVKLVLGEVKSSKDQNTPPGVMNGKSGMKHQLDNLANDLRLVSQLLKWLHPRCKNNEFESLFRSAVKSLLKSNNRDISLFGVLIRDTKSNELDLQARSISLADRVSIPTMCSLLAVYLPCNIDDLPRLISECSS